MPEALSTPWLLCLLPVKRWVEGDFCPPQPKKDILDSQIIIGLDRTYQKAQQKQSAYRIQWRHITANSASFKIQNNLVQ